MLLVLVFVLALLPSPASSPRPTAASILGAARDASGAAAWSSARWIVADGQKTSYGLTGTYHETVDLKTGYFKREARFSEFANAEGKNASGRWRQDSSGEIHPLNSRESITVAATESYLARRGYFARDERTQLVLLEPLEQDGVRYERVEVVPKGGRAATLWIRERDHLIDRVSLQLSERVETIRYADYRRVSGLLLPFRIDLDHGDESDSGTTAIATYRLLNNMPPSALAKPARPDDVRFTSSLDRTTVPARVDDSGFVIVFAKIDGHGPLPFILDTGGHDILTPAAADTLGLKSVGAGESYGAGSGSTLTNFTKVGELAIGDATVLRQPFTVLHLDLGHTRNAAGDMVPIAGILGLEIFERFSVEINFESDTLTLARTFDPRPPYAEVIPLTFTSDMPLVDASLDGVPGSFGLDLGNNVGLILFAPWLAAHGLSAHSESHQSGTSVGGAIALGTSHARNFRLGTVSFTNPHILVSDAKSGSFSARAEAGNIGTPVLKTLRRVTFDYARGSLYVEPRP